MPTWWSAKPPSVNPNNTAFCVSPLLLLLLSPSPSTSYPPSPSSPSPSPRHLSRSFYPSHFKSKVSRFRSFQFPPLCAPDASFLHVHAQPPSHNGAINGHGEILRGAQKPFLLPHTPSWRPRLLLGDIYQLPVPLFTCGIRDRFSAVTPQTLAEPGRSTTRGRQQQ